MYRFRLVLIVAVVWLILVFNLERPERYLYINGINLASPVYVIVATVMGIFLFWPQLAKWSIYVLAVPLLLVYIVTKIIFGDFAFDPNTITEIFVLLVSLWVSKAVANTLTEFSSALTNAVLGTDTLSILPQSEGEKAIKNELTRAKRYMRPASLIYLQILPPKNKAGLLEKSPEALLEYRYLCIQIATVLESLHKHDLLMWYEDKLILFLPEKKYPHIFTDIRQLDNLFRYTFEVETRIGVAVFPNDALVFEQLLSHAMKNIWRPSRETEIVNENDVHFAGAH